MAERPLDLIQAPVPGGRPDRLWVVDLTYVVIWRDFVCVAFVTDVLSRKIVGWRLSSWLSRDLALDALGQALHDRIGGIGDSYDNALAETINGL